MSKPVVLIAEELSPATVDALGPDFEVRNVDGTDRAALLSELATADAILVRSATKVDAEAIAAAPRLKVIARAGVGLDNVDIKAATAAGVMVVNAPTSNIISAAELTVGHILSLARHIPAAHGALAEGQWKRSKYTGVELYEKTIGIIGLGRIGTAVALRAKAFGFRVAFYDPFRPNGTERSLGIERAHTLADLLAGSDVLSLHAPLTRETRGMLGMDELRLLPEGAVVVNTARGPILDLAALEVLLREGRIAGAGLDVLPVEPPVEPIPDLLRAYHAKEPWLAGRLVVTPHAAFHSPEAWADIRRKSAETMAAALHGERAQNVVPPESW